MKKSFKIIAGLAFAGTVLFSSCNKTKDEVTPVNVTKPTVSIEFTDATNATFSKDLTVTTTEDSAFISLGVNAVTTKSTRIYLIKSEDNGIAQKVLFSSKLVGKKYDGTGSNYDFDKSTSYTLEIPSGVGNAFKINIPLALRKGVTSAKSDVYTLWITNGAGDFQNPGKNRVFGGNAIITFKYTNSSLINNYETVLGNSEDTTGSLFSTVDGTRYTRLFADSDSKYEAAVDFAYVNPGNGSAAQYVFGSLKDAVVGNQSNLTWKFFDLSNFATKNDTKFAETTLTLSQFNDIDDEAELLSAIPSSVTATNVTYTSVPSNKVFAFVTVSGKKGLVLVKTAAGDFSTSGQASLQVKVQR